MREGVLDELGEQYHVVVRSTGLGVGAGQDQHGVTVLDRSVVQVLEVHHVALEEKHIGVPRELLPARPRLRAVHQTDRLLGVHPNCLHQQFESFQISEDQHVFGDLLV